MRFSFRPPSSRPDAVASSRACTPRHPRQSRQRTSRLAADFAILSTTMPAPTANLTADAFLRAVEDTLRPLVTGLGGVLDVATDPEHAIELLQTAPPKWRCILGWPGWGDHAMAAQGMGSHRLYLIVQCAAGMTRRPADVLHRGRPSLPAPMMGLLEQASAWMRAMRWPDGSGVDPHGFAQAGSAWLEVEGLETKQHQLDFTIDAALPFESQTIPVAV